jgi:hypothetical protein
MSVGAAVKLRPVLVHAPGAVALRVNLGLLLFGLLALTIVINFFAGRPAFRGQIDATKTRAYSLIPASRELIAGLEGQWTIALVMDEQRADRSMRRQIDEVLSRYTKANPNLKVLRVDPSDPSTMANYDAMLAELQRIYGPAILEYDQALDQGVAAFKSLQLFAQEQAGLLGSVVTRLRPDDPLRSPIEQRISVLGLLADQGELVLSEVAKARQTDSARPIADYETARSILSQALSQWAGEVDDLGRLIGRWLERPDAKPSLNRSAASTREEFSHLASNLAEAAEPLKRLPPMELSAIGQQLAQGEGAVILAPTRAAVIPSQQLFPRSNIRQREDGGVTFDQRFRGEQLISAAIRSLTVPVMPLVVFVHAEEGSLMRQRDKQADLLGVASMLQSSRFEIAEWRMADPASQRPATGPGQAIVWIIVAPPARKGIEIAPPERDLLATAQELVAEGQSVMLSLYPSLLHKLAQSDPWAKLAEPLGISADTSKVIYHAETTSDGRREAQRALTMQDFEKENAIGRAIDGQLAYFALPVPLQAPESPGVTHSVIAAVGPEENSWLESDWSAAPSTIREPTDAQRIGTLPIVVAAQRDAGAGRAGQRAIVVGSGGWMLTYIADVVTSVGGDRVALVYPGNHELLLASVAWLAGMDDLIAASPITQEISRLRGVTPAARTFWFWTLVVIVPLLCVGLGAVVTVVRRI